MAAQALAQRASPMVVERPKRAPAPATSPSVNGLTNWVKAGRPVDRIAEFKELKK